MYSSCECALAKITQVWSTHLTVYLTSSFVGSYRQVLTFNTVDQTVHFVLRVPCATNYDHLSVIRGRNGGGRQCDIGRRVFTISVKL